jgi:hypothetical protein
MGLFDDLIPQQQRAPVQPSARVWGDAEAEAAGLYETRGQPQAQAAQAAQQGQATSGLFDDLIPKTTPANAVAERFPGQPYQNDALKADVGRAARSMTTGPEAGFGQRIALDFANNQSAAGQRTTPNVEAHYPNLVSDQVFESDSGEILYRDSSGNVVPTDKNKHVALRDPADGRLKIFARTADTDEGMLSAGGRILMSGMGAGAATARPAIATASRTIQPAASDILATAKPHYRAFDRAAADVFVPVGNTVERLKRAMTRARQPEHLAKEVYDTVDTLAASGDDAISLTRLRDLKETIGQSSRSNDSRVRAAAGAANAELRKIISEAAPEAGKSLQTADEIYGTSKSVQELQRKGAVADLRAGRAGYGGNAVNTMRQVLSPIVQHATEGKTTSFRPHEIEAMREIVQGNPATNALRFAGQFSPTSGLGAIRSAGAGGAALFADFSGTTALAIPAIGAASNKLATILTGRQIDRLKELVAKRSPEYANAVKRATERYERAQAEFSSKPTPAKFAAYLSASRALSAGLQRDGVQVTSGELLRSIQGPMKAGAEDEQPQPVGVGN